MNESLLDNEIKKMDRVILELPWIELGCGRIIDFPQNNSRQVKRIPAYVNPDGELISFMSNDQSPAYFGYVFGNEKIIDFTLYDTNWQRERTIGIILCARLDLLFPQNPYRKAEAIRKEFEQKLSRVSGLEVKTLLDTSNPERIFEEFDIRESTAETATFPNVFFRWNGTYTYRSC